MKKRLLFASLAALSLMFVWFSIGAFNASRMPVSKDAVSEHLQREALAYNVVDGTPLVIAEYGGTIFLDTLKLDRWSTEFPPYPRWQWTGDWERIDEPAAPATADLSAHFGPLVLFGLVNDEQIVGMEVERDGTVVQTIPVTVSAYILPVTDVLLTDEIHFITPEGDRVITVELMG